MSEKLFRVTHNPDRRMFRDRRFISQPIQLEIANEPIEKIVVISLSLSAAGAVQVVVEWK